MSSKIKDGFFMGDMESAQDAEFLHLNGITRIINCVPRQVPNLFQHEGIQYVTCDLEQQVVLRRFFFDLHNREFLAVMHLIESSLEATEGVLVHSLDGLSRSPSVVIAYLMYKYCWGVDKAYDFVTTKKPDIKPLEVYIDQLCTLETQLQTACQSRATEQQLYEWNVNSVDPKSDELVLVHTFLNFSIKPPVASSAVDFKPVQQFTSHPRRVSWIDQKAELKTIGAGPLLKPERPPNASYNAMIPGDGWVEIHGMASQRSLTMETLKIKDPVMITNSTTPVTTTRALPDESLVKPREEEKTPELEESAHLPLQKSSRVNSFSVPRQTRSKEPQLSENQIPSNEKEDESLTILVNEAEDACVKPRYLQETKSSLNARPKKPTRPLRGSTFRSSGTTVSRVELSQLNLKKATPLDTARTANKLKQAKKAEVKDSKATLSSAFLVKSANIASASASVEFPFPSSRSGAMEISTSQSNKPVASFLNRPRTAPPRLRKTDSTNEKREKLLAPSAIYSTSDPLGHTDLRRVKLEPSFQSTKLSAADFTYRAKSTSSFRPKTVKAQWK